MRTYNFTFSVLFHGKDVTESITVNGHTGVEALMNHPEFSKIRIAILTYSEVETILKGIQK